MSAGRLGSPAFPDFASFRNHLHKELLRRILRRNEPEYCFAPIGTAELVLQTSALRQLFEYVHPQELSRRGISTTVQQLVRQVQRRKLEGILAVLIYSRCEINVLISFIEKIVAVSDTLLNANLTILPLSDDDASYVFEDELDCQSFLQNQMCFCPITIRKRQETTYAPNRRLPYLEQSEIGRGAFGIVYRVKIAPRHFVNPSLDSSNNDVIELARKDYVLASTGVRDPLDDERQVMREILQNNTRNINIMENLGSIQVGNIYSLFLPLATCDLRDYMIGLNPQPPASMWEKANLLSRMADLAGALEHLHDGLKRGHEKLSCYHLDLKPQNILVVQEGDKERWKITDFNMSRVRTLGSDNRNLLRRTTTEGEVDFERIFQRRTPNPIEQVEAPSTVAHREGTYLAPEGFITGRMRAESDAWSLGCVILVLLTYMDGGGEAVEAFTNARLQGRQDDRFFSTVDRPGRREACPNKNVERWCKELRRRARARDRHEGNAVDELLSFVEGKVLEVDPARRRNTPVSAISSKLVEIHGKYLFEERPTPVPVRQPTLKDRLKQRAHTFRNLGFSSNANPKTKSASQKPGRPLANLKLPENVKSCVFSPNSQLVAAYSADKIRLISLVALLSGPTDEEPAYIDCDASATQGPWGTIALTNRYLLVASTKPHFDLYVFEIRNPTSFQGTLELVNHVPLNSVPPIYKVEVDIDERFAAFLLHSGAVDQRKGSIHCVDFEHVIRPESANSHEARSSIVSTSTAQSRRSTIVPVLPWTKVGEPLPLNGPAEHVSELAFSECGILYAVLPDEHRIRVLNIFPVPTWQNPILLVEHQNNARNASLYTASVAHRNEYMLTIILEARSAISVSTSGVREASGTVTNYELLKVYISQDDYRLICLGTKSPQHSLRVLGFDTLRPGHDIDVHDYGELKGLRDSSLYTATIYTGLECPASHSLLVVSHSGELYQMPLS